MRLGRFLVPLLLLSSTILKINAEEDENSGAAATTKSTKDIEEADVDNEEPAIELNPDYVGGNEGGDEGDDDDDEYDDSEDDEEEEEDAKAKTNKALKAGNKSTRFKTMAFLKRHRLKITIAMVLIAFHREIGAYIFNIIKPKLYDPVTQTSTRQWMKLEPTQILKIIVFIDVMRQLQSAGKKRDPIMLAILLLGTRNPILSSLISKAILQENNSYIPPVEQHYTFERLNDRYKKDCLALQKAANVKSKHNLSLSSLSHLCDNSPESSLAEAFSETVIVLDLSNINSAPGRIDQLRDEVSFLIHQHRQQSIPYATTIGDNNKTKEEFELLVILESPGGSAADFALASQQLLRLRKEPGIKVTVCVDKVAASGGYMIACAASSGRLFAAPFAVLGSIGVIGQTVNVQKTLEGWGVRPMVFKAGRDKAPIGLIGEIKPSDVKSIQTMVDETHEAFKRHVVNARPSLEDDIEELATGKVWMGYDALEVGLIDRLVTSDEYIGERMQDGARLLQLMKNTRKRGLLGGGHQSRGGIESRIQSSILCPIKDQVLKTLHRVVGRINLPDEVEELDEVVPLVSRVGYKNIETSSAHASFATASSHYGS